MELICLCMIIATVNGQLTEKTVLDSCCYDRYVHERSSETGLM